MNSFVTSFKVISGLIWMGNKEEFICRFLVVWPTVVEEFLDLGILVRDRNSQE